VTDPVQRQLDAYNARDADRFAACFSPRIRVFSSLGTLVIEGRGELGRHYAQLFATHPHLHAESVSQLHLGSWVVEEERVTGLRDEAVHALGVYRVVDGVIVEAGYLD
jgi:hypothetical protein